MRKLVNKLTKAIKAYHQCFVNKYLVFEEEKLKFKIGPLILKLFAKYLLNSKIIIKSLNRHLLKVYNLYIEKLLVLLISNHS